MTTSATSPNIGQHPQHSGNIRNIGRLRRAWSRVRSWWRIEESNTRGDVGWRMRFH